MVSKPPAIVYPVSHAAGMSVIRALQGRDIPIVAVSPAMSDAGMHSKHVIPTPGGFEQLPAIARSFTWNGEKPVLFCVDDEDVYASLQREDFAEAFRLPSSGWDVVAPMVDKGLMYERAIGVGFDVPVLGTHATPPYVVKPKHSAAFRVRYGVKAKRFYSISDANCFKARATAEGTPCLIQEHIPGDETNLYTYAAYSTEGGEVVAGFTGRKLYQWPRDFGTARLAESVDAPDVESLGRALLRHWGYKGISLTEFKRDPRDGRLKLIEVNPRPGGWPERLALACGVNLVYEAYKDAIGEPPPPPPLKPLPPDYVEKGIGPAPKPKAKRWANTMEYLYYARRWPGFATDAFWDRSDRGPFWARLRGWLRQEKNREYHRHDFR